MCDLQCIQLYDKTKMSESVNATFIKLVACVVDALYLLYRTSNGLDDVWAGCNAGYKACFLLLFLIFHSRKKMWTLCHVSV